MGKKRKLNTDKIFDILLRFLGLLNIAFGIVTLAKDGITNTSGISDIFIGLLALSYVRLMSSSREAEVRYEEMIGNYKEMGEIRQRIINNQEEIINIKDSIREDMETINLSNELCLMGEMLSHKKTIQEFIEYLKTLGEIPEEEIIRLESKRDEKESEIIYMIKEMVKEPEDPEVTPVLKEIIDRGEYTKEDMEKIFEIEMVIGEKLYAKLEDEIIEGE